MVQEVLVVEDRLFRLFFALLELELFAGLLGSLEFFPSIDTLPVLMLIGLVSIVACLFTVLLTLLLFLLLGLALHPRLTGDNIDQLRGFGIFFDQYKFPVNFNPGAQLH